MIRLEENRYGSTIGARFGRLTLTAILPCRIHRRVAGRFRCDCGAERNYPISRVRAGRITHCGCQTDHGASRTHGRWKSPEYRSWSAMKSRCLDPGCKDYPRYGRVGVRVHPAWMQSFEAFFADVGPRPPGTSLDRIDATGHYEPGNVRWATPQVQSENRLVSWTVEIRGVRYPSVEAAARAHGVTTTTVVRWCDGGRDPRRGDTWAPPHTDCRRWRTYP